VFELLLSYVGLFLFRFVSFRFVSFRFVLFVLFCLGGSVRPFC
jgi:hypothetical protein